jgi:hypothetical protein
MKDWRTIAKASELTLPERDLDRIVEPLAALEAKFRPLVSALTPDMEPCFRVDIEEPEA